MAKLRDMLAGLEVVQSFLGVDEESETPIDDAKESILYYDGPASVCPVILIANDEVEATGVNGGRGSAYVYEGRICMLIEMPTPAEFRGTGNEDPDTYLGDALVTVENQMSAILAAIRGVAGRNGNLTLANFRKMPVSPSRTDKPKQNDRLMYAMMMDWNNA